MSIDHELFELKRILQEKNLQSNFDFFRNPKNRKRLQGTNPAAFLGLGKKNLPIFPVIGQDGCLSLPLLKKSLGNAKRLCKTNGSEKYYNVVKRLEKLIDDVKSKKGTMLQKYKNNDLLSQVIDRRDFLHNLEIKND